MNTIEHHKPNELEMAFKILNKAIDRLIEEKPKGGLIVNKGTDIEAKMSYVEAKKCLDRIKTKYDLAGAFSFGICGECTSWNTGYFTLDPNKSLGKCGGNTKHRYDGCVKHSKENGGWGLQCMRP